MYVCMYIYIYIYAHILLIIILLLLKWLKSAHARRFPLRPPTEEATWTKAVARCKQTHLSLYFSLSLYSSLSLSP